jgi:hypothetical protein
MMMNAKERAAFLRGYNAGRAVTRDDVESGSLAKTFRKTSSMSQKTIDRLIRTYGV